MFATFYMKNMIPLRIVGMASNVTFIFYAGITHVWPLLVLHIVLLPMNLLRLVQMIRLINQVRLASNGDMSFDFMIPHMTKEYLAESDEDKKRYYYCHCPWVKESLKDGASQIPATFCNCSAAYHKKSWEVIFERTLEAEIVESVLQGDLWCKIAIHLPE